VYFEPDRENRETWTDQLHFFYFSGMTTYRPIPLHIHFMVPDHTFLDFFPYYRFLLVLCMVMLLIELMYIWESGSYGPGVDIG